MFKNLIIYRVPEDWGMDLDAMEAALATMPFTPCEGAQEKTYGWVPPRGVGHGALVESIHGQRIMCFAIESKSVPSSTIKRGLEARVAKIEAEYGRKPGRKECRDLRDEVVHELLPYAFPKTTHVLVWFDRMTGLMVLNTSSQGKADEVVSALVKVFDGLSVRLLNTQVAPQAAMTQWLTGTQDEWPKNFAAGRKVELKSGDEMNSVVKFDRHHLDDDQMRLHIGQGKLPVKLGMEWDGRVSFVLTDSTQIRNVAYLDGVFDKRDDQDEGGFDADVALVTGELQCLIRDLVAALGGGV